jgi:hypothetical protein
MADEKKLSTFKQVKTAFVGDDNLPTHYVNMINICAGLEEFFLTLGTVVPLEIADNQDLEGIDNLNGHPLFRCAVSRSVMKQVIDLMANLYENQTKQIEQLQNFQGKDEQYDDSNSRSS